MENAVFPGADIFGMIVLYQDDDARTMRTDHGARKQDSGFGTCAYR